MNWFLVALGAPLVWSLVNHCDKIILQRYFKGDGSGGLMIFTGVIAIPIAIILAIINPSVLYIPEIDVFYLISSGILYNIAIFLYLKALEDEDASYLVPFWQLMPVFGYFFGVIFLGEYLGITSIIGGLVAIIGAAILSFEFEEGKNVSFRIKAVTLMTASSLFGALSDVLFKAGGVSDLSFFTLIFWNQIGMFIFATAFFADRHFREEFLDVFKLNSKGAVSLNILEQLVEVAGVVMNNFALLLAPVSLVILVTMTAQPIFVFIEGLFLTILFPKLVQENISTKHVLQKIISILIMGAGLYMITK